MGGVLFQYGTAAHLAILTVAPLFLSVIFSPSVQATALLWLSLFAAMWIVANPTPQAGEWPRDARKRIGWELVRDPFLTFAVIAVVLAAIRAINGGITLKYSASTGLWMLSRPIAPLLPGSVSGEGFLPLAGLVSLSVVTLGVRHALGSRALKGYLLLTALLSSAWILYFKFRLPAAAAIQGSLLGVYFLFAVAAWVSSWTDASVVLELIAAFAVAVLLGGMLLFASSFALCVFATAGVVLVLLGLGLTVLRRRPTEWFKTVLAFLIAVAPVGLVVMGEISRPPLWPLFPDGFVAMRAAATSIAIDAWREIPQLGVGIGAFPLALGFHATPDDWQVLPVGLTAVPNGWVHFLFERGIFGAIIILAGLALIFRDGILRYVRAGSGWSLSVLHFFGPLVFLAVAAVLFVDCTFVQFQALMPVGGALALTTVSFPLSSEVEYG